jgi:hypothetical protein
MLTTFISHKAVFHIILTPFPILTYHTVYEQMHDLLTQRIRTEDDLMDMLHDRAADGSPLDPHRDFEKDYKRLDQATLHGYKSGDVHRLHWIS